MTISPTDLSKRLAKGLLSFPVTFFDADGAFNEDGYRAHVAAQSRSGISGLFAAGGTGEFFSLRFDEYERVVKAAASETPADVPLLAGVGYGTEMAIAFARAAEAAGAQGILVLPPYLVHADQEGLRRHLTAICQACGLGVIAYNRDNSVLTPDSVAKVAEKCPNLIGFKDGVGNIETLTLLRAKVGDRLILVGGMPTAEVYASAAQAIGMTTYSSAIYNFAPKTALAFYQALRAGRRPEVEALLEKFFMPYLAIRNRRAGYVVSIVKAGVRIAGFDCGPVRLPLLDLTVEEETQLAALMSTCDMPVSGIETEGVSA